MKRELHHRAGDPLTYRQIQTLQLRADGLTQRQCAERLGLHPVTLDDHLINARMRLDARTTVHAIALALRQKIIR